MPRQAVVIRVIRVTIDLSVKHIGRKFERVDLRKERIWQASELLIELANLDIVQGKLVHELHLLHFSLRQAPLKIREVWDLSEVVLELEDGVSRGGDVVLDRRSLRHEVHELHVLLRIRLRDHRYRLSVSCGLRCQDIGDVRHQAGEGDGEAVDGWGDGLALLLDLVKVMLRAQDTGLALLPWLQVKDAAVSIIAVAVAVAIAIAVPVAVAIIMRGIWSIVVVSSVLSGSLYLYRCL